MSCPGWYSKKDVLKDLRLAAGQRGLALDEGSVLVGEQPPPLRADVLDDEECLQLLRLSGGHHPQAAMDSITHPDFAGITHMLRMVDHNKEKESKTPIIKRVNNIIEISKLNPNSREFMPKKLATDEIKERNETDNCFPSTTNGKRVGKGEKIEKVIEGKIETEKVKEEMIETEKVKEETTNTEKIEEKKFDTEKMKEGLRKKINDSSKAICPKVKRERNLAIQTLIKLHSVTPTKVVDKNPVLISPAYFEKHKENDLETNDPKSVIDNNLAETVTDGFTAADIAASVDKVKKWLHDSTETNNSKTSNEKSEMKKSDTERNNDSKKQQTMPVDKPRSSPYLGVITFKRKATSKPISPTSSGSTEIKVPKCPSYKPSQYVTELVQKYTQYEANLEAKQDIWSKLEKELKIRDEDIKKKKANAQLEATCLNQTVCLDEQMEPM